MRIRSATKKDIRDIAKLMLEEFTKPPFNERAAIPAVIKSLNFYFKLGKIFVVIIDKRLVGVVVFKVEQWWDGKLILIEDLAVKKTFKKQGINKALIDRVEQYARKNKINSVSFTTHKKSSAIEFYKRLGYKVEKNTIFMRKSVK